MCMYMYWCAWLSAHVCMCETQECVYCSVVCASMCACVVCMYVCIHVSLLSLSLSVYTCLSSLSLCVCVSVCVSTACVLCIILHPPTPHPPVWLGVWCTPLQSTENNKLHRQQSRAQPLPCSTSRSACLSRTTTCMYVCKCVMHLINPALFIYKYVSFGVIILNYTFNPLISSFQSPEIQ